MSGSVSNIDDDEMHALLRLLDSEQSRADVLMNVVIPIGVALVYETDWEQLLHRIISDAMGLCLADGGSIFLIHPLTNALKPVVTEIRSLSLKIVPSPTNTKDSPEVLGCGAGIAARAARLGNSISVTDVQIENLDDHRFDEQYKYRTESCLAVPLRGQTGEMIGIVCLVNAHRPNDQRVCPFEMGMQQVVESLCLLASTALESYLRQQKLKDQVRELTIQIDESRKGQQVTAIVESDYFKALQGRARELRSAITKQ